MTNTTLRAAALLILHVLWLPQARAADATAPQFKDELSKQEQIYQSRGEKVPDGYVIDRSLLSYAHTLPPAFDLALALLGPQDRWLDIGAGRGQAVIDYFDPRYDRMHYAGQERPDRKAQAVAMSIEDRRTEAWHQQAATLKANQMRYLFDKRLREYAPGELGQFQVISDVLGGFSYSTDITLFMERVLGMLDLNGSFFTVLQDVHAEDGKNKPYYEGASFLTELTNPAGAEVRLCAWLKSIACVKVTCEFKTGWKPPIEAYHVQKVCNEVKVPALTPVHFVAGTPPGRKFKLKN
ncbi:MAG: hypothetical protein K8S22_08960 [Betaproteobacteria bacterium]|nr:hypothetical protein [Betaproteobacteria bacterium]